MKWGAMAVAVLLAAFVVQTSFAQSEAIEARMDPTTASSTSSDGKQMLQEAFKPKSPWVAGGLAVGTPIGLYGVALINNALFYDGEGVNYPIIPPLGLALTVAPSSGHLYAEEYKHGALFSAGRIVLLPLTVALGVGAGLSGNAGVGILALASGVGYWSLTIYDFVDAPRAARRYNERKRMEQNRSHEDR